MRGAVFAIDAQIYGQKEGGMRKRMFLMAAIAAIPFFQPAASKATITLFLNEGNCVSGTKYLETSSTGKDTGPLISTVNGGYVQGNGQNWMELVVGAPA